MIPEPSRTPIICFGASRDFVEEAFAGHASQDS